MIRKYVRDVRRLLMCTLIGETKFDEILDGLRRCERNNASSTRTTLLNTESFTFNAGDDFHITYAIDCTFIKKCLLIRSWDRWERLSIIWCKDRLI